MKVPAFFYATEEMLYDILKDKSLEQLVNITTLPGIQKKALAMPDIHEGYGFPIGGVAATLYPDGAISPAGIGYDINCGVRLLKSQITFKDIKPYLQKLAKHLFFEIPAGVGKAKDIKLGTDQLNKILNKGSQAVIAEGYGDKIDISYIEEYGKLSNADPSLLSENAKRRGEKQLGTIGAGNHFVEIERVDEIFDKEIARNFGLFKNQVTILIHTGSRGLGHQVATDYIHKVSYAMTKYGITAPNKDIASVPFSSIEGKEYFNAMASAANFAFANRQIISYDVRRVWKNILGDSGGKLSLLYDVSHNSAKIEKHIINNRAEKVIVHRKGATRAFEDQPVIIPGSMGTASYVLIGTNKAMVESFGSSCHGAGRRMSRRLAHKEIQGEKLLERLQEEGILIQTESVADLSEEAPSAYKNIHEVVEIIDKAGIAKKVARLTPAVVIKA